MPINKRRIKNRCSAASGWKTFSAKPSRTSRNCLIPRFGLFAHLIYDWWWLAIGPVMDGLCARNCKLHCLKSSGTCQPWIRWIYLAFLQWLFDLYNSRNQERLNWMTDQCVMVMMTIMRCGSFGMGNRVMGNGRVLLDFVVNDVLTWTQ